MQDKNELQEFDLDDILSEFQDLPEADADASGDLSDILGDWAEEAPAPVQEPALVSDTIRMNDLISQLAAEREAEEQEKAAVESVPTEEESGAVPMDTLRMNDLISQIMEETEGSAPSDNDTIRVENLAQQLPDRPEQAPEATEEATLRMDPLSPDATRRMETLDAHTAPDDVSGEPTRRLDAVEEDPKAKGPAILYNPRTRLRELKKKLVAGPEKRYYELSEMGVGRIQAAILFSLVIAVLSIITSTLFALDMIPENRLRFVIFSQILAMLLSAFLGAGQMVEGFLDIFKGRFGIKSMLLFTLIACCADAVLCLSELRIPCCAAFSLEITMALWAQYQRHSTEMAQMDTLRKAVQLHAVVREPDYYNGKDGLLRRDGEVEDFMDHYNRLSAPEILQSVYCAISLLVCIAIAVFAGMMHSVSMGIQILSTALLVAVPASFFVTLTRPAALLERRLHMVGSVLCSWKGIRSLCGKAAFPLRDEDLFPVGTTKLNGVKFYGSREPDEVVSYTASLIGAAGGSLAPVFRKMQESRNCVTHAVDSFRDYGSGGIGGEICGEPVLLGTLDFMQDMGVEIPEGTMVSQAVYAAIDGDLCAVFAISYAKMRSSAAGIISLCANRRISPVMVGTDFMLTDSLLRAKFSINTRRIAFPDQGERYDLDVRSDDAEAPALALATRDDLAAYAYAVSGARALRTSCRLGMVIHLLGGILGLAIMAALAFLGTTELLTPTHVLLYQLIWMIPGLLITEWTRTV